MCHFVNNLPAHRRGGPKSPSAFGRPSEVQLWADGKAPDGTKVVSLSHCWESREHCDPYGYQVSKLAKALTGKEWLFIDYVSLYQFQRLSQQQNLSFRRAMQHMHVLYCHDKTSTLRIESLTPEADIAKAERNQDCVILYHHPTGLVKPVPVGELVKIRIPRMGEASQRCGRRCLHAAAEDAAWFLGGSSGGRAGCEKLEQSSFDSVVSGE